MTPCSKHATKLPLTPFMTGTATSRSRRPVRVMHVLYRLQAGGMEYGVIKLTNGLDPDRVRSAICSTCPATPVKELLRPSVELFEYTRRDGNDPALVWQLYRLLRRERPDVVHTHAWGTLIEGIVAAKLAGVPAIVHGEHGTLQTRPGQIRAQKWAWKSVNRVLSVSSRLAERMAAQVGFPLERVTTIRNGVDLARFNRAHRDEARQHLGLGSADLAIGTVGRLVDVKDHAGLLSALAALRRQVRGFKAFIAGEGPLRAALEQQLEALGLCDIVRLIGHQSNVERFLSALDIFVLSSKSEGLSNTIQEAMACGVAVVATNVGGADELVIRGDTGLLVPPLDSDGLAGAIEVLARNAGLRQAMGEAGGLRARREFSVERMLEQYADLYLELAAARQSENPAGIRASQGLPG